MTERKFTPPKKQAHWANDYGSRWVITAWWDTRVAADVAASQDRIAVIRREWVEGQLPQYFTAEV